MNISYDWYKIFCYVADCQSITLAAEKLYISQPAVSQCIHQLEESVGCLLFIRTPKGVKLSAEGQMLYTFVLKGIAAFSEGERKLTAMLRLDIGEIKIGASDMTLEYCLLPFLEKFHEQYPNVKISITNNPTPQTTELLKQGKIDFAAVSEPISSNEFEAVAVRKINDIFICGIKYNIPDKSLISMFSDELILLESNTSTRTYIDSEFRKRGFVSVPKFELATSHQIVQFTAKNMGIGCVVSDFAKEAIANGEVREIKVFDALPSRNICILRNSSETSKAANTLVSMIIENG